MPFTNPAARYGQQAANIGDILAAAKARGIQEGSRAWKNILVSLGVSVQQWPSIKRQLELNEIKRRQASDATRRRRVIASAILQAGGNTRATAGILSSLGEPATDIPSRVVGIQNTVRRAR